MDLCVTPYKMLNDEVFRDVEEGVRLLRKVRVDLKKERFYREAMASRRSGVLGWIRNLFRPWQNDLP